MLTSLLLLAALSPQRSMRDDPGAPAMRATNELGLALFRALDQEHPGQNLFLSPLSVTVALAMLAEGASDATAAELAQVLHLAPGTPLVDLHRAFQALLARYRDGGGAGDPELRQRVTDLQAQLAAANTAAQARAQGADWQAAAAAQARARDLAAQLNRLLPQLDRYELRTANALWVERSQPLVPAYAAALDHWYGTGGVRALDIRGDAEAARNQINAWVEAQTERHIKDLIPPGGITAATALVLSNAVFFRGAWAEPFPIQHTRDADFLHADGRRTQVRLMRDADRAQVPYAAFSGTGRFFATPREVPAGPGAKPPATYPDDDGFTMVELPYKGGELAMVVIAPRAPDGLPRLERQLSATTLAAWLKHLAPRAVDTALPRFELRQGAELSRALQVAGIHRAFVSPQQADGAQFQGITAAADPAQQLFVSRVHHQAWLQVHERGTEAAAATAVVVDCGAAAPDLRMVPFVPVFRADRPFLFLIRDTRSGAILFLGRMVEPTP